MIYSTSECDYQQEQKQVHINIYMYVFFVYKARTLIDPVLSLQLQLCGMSYNQVQPVLIQFSK